MVGVAGRYGWLFARVTSARPTGPAAVEQTDRLGKTALLHACAAGRPHTVSTLVDLGYAGVDASFTQHLFTLTFSPLEFRF